MAAFTLYTENGCKASKTVTTFKVTVEKENKEGRKKGGKRKIERTKKQRIFLWRKGVQRTKKQSCFVDNSLHIIQPSAMNVYNFSIKAVHVYKPHTWH